jgi:hypothetical protein
MGLHLPGRYSDYPLGDCMAAKGVSTEVDGKTRAITDNLDYSPGLLHVLECSSSPIRPGILMLMSFGRAPTSTRPSWDTDPRVSEGEDA